MAATSMRVSYIELHALTSGVNKRLWHDKGTDRRDGQQHITIEVGKMIIEVDWIFRRTRSQKVGSRLLLIHSRMQIQIHKSILPKRKKKRTMLPNI